MARRWAPIKRLAICKRCKGQCCYISSMTIVLDREQYDRKLYMYRYEKKRVDRIGPDTAVLKKRKDGSCVYYDREKRVCSIYARRPHSCKAFFCGRGRKGTSNNGWRPKDWVWRSLLEKERADGTPT
jgi:Fe-S-cluster containining protein